jgi:hypothetical protein
MARTPVALALLASSFFLAAPASALLGENLIAQPTFDEGINGWENLAGKLWEQEDDAFPLDVQPNPGSLEMLADPIDGVFQCIGIVGDQPYSIQVYLKTMLTGDAFGKAGISVTWHSDAFCEHYLEGPYIHPFSYQFGATDWKKLELASGAPLAAHSARVTLGAERTAGTGDSEMRVRFDEVIVAPIYFGTTTTMAEETTTTTTTDTVTSTTDEIGAPGCADPVTPYDTITVADALYVLRRSVGLVPCATCQCDSDSSGTTTAGDALRTLRLAVGQPVSKHCGGCEG